jgi:hypothetical protein
VRSVQARRPVLLKPAFLLVDEDSCGHREIELRQAGALNGKHGRDDESTGLGDLIAMCAGYFLDEPVGQQ